MDSDNFLDIFKPMPIQNADNVYYSSEVNRFFQVKSIADDYYICGGFTKYYSDSISNIQRQKLSYNFLKKSVSVKQVDKFAEYDGIGWKVKEEQK